MAGEREFIEHIREMMAPLGAVRVRPMFGGFGIFLGDVMFALVSDDTLYLKADEHSRTEFESKGLAPFAYERRGKMTSMSYYEMPESALDDPAEFVRWAALAHKAAVRSAGRSAQKGSRSVRRKVRGEGGG